VYLTRLGLHHPAEQAGGGAAGEGAADDDAAEEATAQADGEETTAQADGEETTAQADGGETTAQDDGEETTAEADGETGGDVVQAVAVDASLAASGAEEKKNIPAPPALRDVLEDSRGTKRSSTGVC
jgi:hypothetical protein